jgi:hypothetical protein
VCNNLLNLNFIPNSIKLLSCENIIFQNLDVLPENLEEIRLFGCPINSSINGVIDLSKFVKLEKFHCEKSKITSIINFPNSLKILICNDNNITFLHNLQDSNSLKILICNDNNITFLHNLPDSVSILQFSNNPIESLNNIPINLTVLDCFNTNIQTLNNIPTNLKKLNCNKNLLNLQDIKYKYKNVDITHNEIFSYYFG